MITIDPSLEYAPSFQLTFLLQNGLVKSYDDWLLFFKQLLEVPMEFQTLINEYFN
jgi:hypothetical protein